MINTTWTSPWCIHATQFPRTLRRLINGLNRHIRFRNTRSPLFINNNICFLRRNGADSCFTLHYSCYIKKFFLQSQKSFSISISLVLLLSNNRLFKFLIQNRSCGWYGIQIGNTMNILRVSKILWFENSKWLTSMHHSTWFFMTTNVYFWWRLI